MTDDAGRADDALWRLFLANLPKALIGNVGCAVLFGGLLWWEGSGLAAPAWIAGVIAVNLLRYAVLQRYRDQALAPVGHAVARRLQLELTGLGGLVWGVGLFIILPWPDFALHMVACAFAAGLSAGALASSSPVLAAYVVFIVGLNGPLVLFLVGHFTPLHLFVALASVLFTILMIAMARTLNRQTREVFVTREANQGLIRDLEEARDRALESDRIKGRFLATMSHELRTPLNVILGFAQAIEKAAYGPLGNERYVESARSIRESGEHLLSLINDVLDLSRIEAGEYPYRPEWVDAADIVRGIARAFGPTAEEAGVHLIVDIPSEPMVARADERGLRQILINLAANAIKFTPEDGSVTLELRQREAGDLAVTVRDTGVGIAAQDQARVLEPFVQADNSHARRYEGSGLGLALSKQLAELHGGDLELESTPGEGTRVTVTLPGVAPRALQETASQGG